MAKEPRKIGFIVNPIAGMGGKVGLKGTDGVADDAIKRGAEPVSSERAKLFLEPVKDTLVARNIKWHTATGKMGHEIFQQLNIEAIIDYSPTEQNTTADDTKKACRAFLNSGCELVIFCGGDGTARDVYSVMRTIIPILGIPSGVKMHSAVFAVNPKAGGELLVDFLQGGAEIQKCEIIDLDEEQYRQGNWNVKLYGVALTPYEPAYIQGGKAMVEAIDDEKVKDAIADHVIEEMEHDKNILYIIGPGSTTYRIGERVGIDKTLLGVDCILDGKLVAKDVSEKEILGLLSKYGKAKIVVSPIGAQGFIFGRGNLQISDCVLEKVNLNDIIVVSTPAKLARTPVLRIDVDSPELKMLFRKKKYIFVVTGYRLKVMRDLADSD